MKQEVKGVGTGKKKKQMSAPNGESSVNTDFSIPVYQASL